VELGDVSMSTVTAGGQHVRRTRSLIARSEDEYLLASIQLQGRGWVEQDDQVAQLGVGCMAFYDSSRPYTLHFDDAFEQLVVQVPLTALPTSTGRWAGTRLMTARRLDDGGVGRVVADFFTSLARARRDDSATAALLPHALGLLGAAFESPGGTASSSDSHAAALERVVSLLRQRHCDPDLSVDAIAMACHMSRRTLYRLFESQGGVANYLRRLRVEHAQSMLLVHPDRPLGAIAVACGFHGESQFYRAFRAVIGRAPGEYRRQAGPEVGTLRQ
jgi:AraC-like DNA-binding protein